MTWHITIETKDGAPEIATHGGELPASVSLTGHETHAHTPGSDPDVVSATVTVSTVHRKA